MTATRTLVELDEQTKDELQPPCDIVGSRTRRPCNLPAAWIVLLGPCPNCNSKAHRRILLCDGHASWFMARKRSHCRGCSSSVQRGIVSMEKL